MVMRNVPMYQAKIPIRGGGGLRHIDLREREETNPIVAALQQFMQLKRQKEQDELARRETKADIAYRQKATDVLGQPKPVKGIIVRGEKTIKLVNPYDGSEIADLGPPPKGDKANKALDAIIAMGRMSTAIGKDIPESELSTELGKKALQAERQKLTDTLDREQFERSRQKATLPGGGRQYYPGGVRFPPTTKTPITEALEKTEPKKDLATIAGELKQRPQRALTMKVPPGSTFEEAGRIGREGIKPLPPTAGYKPEEMRPLAQTPITDALKQRPQRALRMKAKLGDMVKMQAPDGKKYMVPAAGVKEAEGRGWRRL